MKPTIVKSLLLFGLLLLLVACSAPATSEPDDQAGATVPATAVFAEEAPTDTAVPPLEAPLATPTDEPTDVPTTAPTEVPVATATEVPDQSAPGEIALAAVLDPAYSEYELVTLLPRDGIPAIDDPQFLSVEDADIFYDPGEFIIGVAIDGEARAYSIPLLGNHEVVNDTVGGRQIAVTW